VTAPVATLGPVSAGGGGFCGRCGTPFGAGSGAFCAHCGNRVRPQPTVASNYSYPAVPAQTVPAAQHKVNHLGVIIGVFGTLLVLVVVLTAIAVNNSPTTSLCHFTCGPDYGPRYLSRTAYVNSQYGFRVEYEQPFSVQQQTSNGVEFSASFGFMTIIASSGNNLSAAIQNALGTLNTSQFQDMQEVSSSVPGAEIGYVLGQGVVYTATFVPSNGGSSFTAVVICLAASQGNLTIAELAAAPQDKSSVGQLPFGLVAGTAYDFEVANTIWPGGT